jgi:hypothetical protein
MFVKYNAGVRHVMVVFPLLAVIAGCGCGFLWHLPGRWQVWGRSTLAALLLWQCISSFSAAPDYIAYFHGLAGRDPSRILVAGCDLDCGQDLFRLSQALHERHISHLNLAIWSSAEMSQMSLPAYEILPPAQPVTGWVAISRRSLRLGDVFHTSYPLILPTRLPGLTHVSQWIRLERRFFFIICLRKRLPGQQPPRHRDRSRFRKFIFASRRTVSTMALRLQGEIEHARSPFSPLDGDCLRSAMRSAGPHRAVHQPRGILQPAGGGRYGRSRIGRGPAAASLAEPRSGAIFAIAGVVERTGNSLCAGGVL